MNLCADGTVRNTKRCWKVTELKQIVTISKISYELRVIRPFACTLLLKSNIDSLDIVNYLGNKKIKEMEYTIVLQELKNKFEDKILSVDEAADIFTITVDSGAIKAIVTYLKEKQSFIYLTDLCGIHYPEQEKELGVIYHLHNLVANKRIRLKAFVSKAQPQIDSIVSLFSGANWMERETYDFYGVDFVGHPNLIRILNVEYMDYHPMRKEYPLEDATRSDKDDRFFGR